MVYSITIKVPSPLEFFRVDGMKLRLIPDWGEKKHERKKIHLSRYFMPQVQGNDELDIYATAKKRLLQLDA